MRAQRQSELEKHGEGASHEAAKTRLVKVLMDCGFEVFPDAEFTVEWDMYSKNKAALIAPDVYFHEWDIYCEKEHSNGLTSKKIFEIDGSSHEKKKQQNRDHTAGEYAEFFLKDCPVYRVPISELIGNHKLTDAELWILYKLR